MRGLGRCPADCICCLVPQARLVAVAEIDAGHSTQMVSELEIEHSYSSFGARLSAKIFPLYHEPPLQTSFTPARFAERRAAISTGKIQATLEATSTTY